MTQAAFKDETQAIRDFLGLTDTRRIGEIVEQVSKISGVHVRDILGNSRRASIVKVRHVAQWKARNEGYTLEQIGKTFNRDHTSILYGIRRVDEALGTTTERAN